MPIFRTISAKVTNPSKLPDNSGKPEKDARNVTSRFVFELQHKQSQQRILYHF